MKVILAEKPSVGKSIAACLGVSGKGDGYLEDNGYIVTWAFGHLVGLAEPETYLANGGDGKWNLEDLPIIPEKFIYEPKLADGGTRKQFNTIKKLFNDADEIICATDAGREGEAIFRYIYDVIHCKKPVKRLWISSLTDVAIKKGFSDLHDGDEFLNLYESAKARAEADWLIGMNATRALTLSAGNGSGVLSIGRVQTPTLGMICNRFLENKNFIPKPFFTVNCELEKGSKFFASLSDRFDKKEDAELIISSISDSLTLSDKIQTEIKEKAPLPFDITSLQAEANRRFKFKAQKTLDIVQSLYEAKKVTYPRTGSRYLGTDMIDEVAKKIGKLSSLQYSTAFVGCANSINNSCINKTCFNDAKLTDHHAIIPTFENISNDASDFNEDKKAGISKEDERKIYELITKQLVMALLPVCVKDKLTYEFSIDNDRKLTASGISIKEAGWRAIFEEVASEEDEREENQKLPNLQKGDVCSVISKNILSKMTQKPPLLTEASLLKKMESAGKDIDDSELSKAIKDCGLGTPATRAAIIETLFKRQYVVNEKNYLVPTDRGLSLFLLIKDYPVADVSMTGEWEMKLNKIADGDFSKGDFNEEIKVYTKNLTSNLSLIKAGSVAANVSSRPVVGKCPVCGKDIIEGQKSFYCSGYKKDDENSCNFAVRKEIAGKAISSAQVKKLLLKGQTDLISGFTSKSDKKFDAFLTVEGNEVKIKFPERKENVVVGKCPVCGKDLVEGSKCFFCSGHKKDDENSCNFVIWKELAGKAISSAQIEKLLANGKSDLIKGFISKSGKKFDAYLVLEENKVNFKFPDKK